MKKRVFRRWANDPPELDKLVAARLDLAREEAVALIERGSVSIDGERALRHELLIEVGQKIAVHLGHVEAAPPLVFAYRDQDVAVVDKPAGLPSQAEPSQQAFALTAAVTRDLGGYARLMHRLDKDASGLVVVALQRAMYEPLQRAFAEHAVERRYLAIVGGELVGDKAVRARIGRHPRDQRLRVALPENATAGEAACTRYRTLAHGHLDGAPITAVELVLETGRTHQIRVHMMSIGHSLVGDTAYGGAAFERLCLHAYSVALLHPRTRKPLAVSSPMPEPFGRLVPRLTRPFS
jgi:23S rRNA pseudouridine1911/1915/1917 synthase